MALKEHPDYMEEKNRLNYIVKYVESSIEAAENNRKYLREDTRQAFIDLDPTDSSLSYSRIMLNTEFLDSLKKNYDGLVKAKKKPYFCRIDFIPDGSSNTNKLYIGKTSLSRAEDDAPVIIDWRSPVASVYYDGRLGRVSYETPEGETSGELKLKRQYTINDSRLENIMDVDVTTTDNFLQEALGENKDNRLKDIVSTIQAEQNEIIRADIDSPLIIQGAAGSGKTTIALHRIAYLIYTYEETFDPDSFLIIAPNKLFLNYISEVLPELGVEEVTQTTFFDLVKDLSGIKYKLAGTDEKLEMFIKMDDGENVREKKHLVKMSEFKCSLEFRDIIDNYVSFLEENFCPDVDFYLEDYVIYNADEIRYMFLTDLSYIPICKRINEIKKTLTNKLKMDKVSIIEQVEEYYEEDRKNQG